MAISLMQQFVLFVSKFLRVLLGSIFSVPLILFLLASCPVYIYRLLVVYLAKILRPDLGDILGGYCAGLASDFFSSKPPRNNIVVTHVIKGQITGEKVKELIMKAWINGKDTPSSYQRFYQYPVKWMGFTFWKNGRDTFDIDKHVKLLTGSNTSFTEKDLDEIMENLLNCKLPTEQSPWKVFVVENYLPANSTDTNHSLLITNWHHCLADGVAMMIAFMHAVHEGFSLDMLKLPNIQLPKRTFWQTIWFTVTFPLNVFIDLSDILSFFIRPSPLKIPDSKKQWHQLYFRSNPIPIQDLKKIKNSLGVSMTSIILSAISAAVDKYPYTTSSSVLCGSVLPIYWSNRSAELTNSITGVVFDLPVRSFKNSLARLYAIDQLLRSKRNSGIPIWLSFYSMLGGNHLNAVAKLCFTNKLMPIGFSNIVGLPKDLVCIGNGMTCTQCFSISGAASGDTGIVFNAVSINQEMRIQMGAEEGLMSKHQAQVFFNQVLEEITLVFQCTQQTNNK